MHPQTGHCMPQNKYCIFKNKSLLFCFRITDNFNKKRLPANLTNMNNQIAKCLKGNTMLQSKFAIGFKQGSKQKIIICVTGETESNGNTLLSLTTWL